MLDESTLEKLKDGVILKIWGWFQVFGSISLGMFGIYIAFKTLKFVLDTAIHLKALQEVYGFGVVLIGSLWDSVTTYLLHRGSTERQSELSQRRQMESKYKDIEAQERHDLITPPPMYDPNPNQECTIMSAKNSRVHFQPLVPREEELYITPSPEEAGSSDSNRLNLYPTITIATKKAPSAPKVPYATVNKSSSKK